MRANEFIIREFAPEASLGNALKSLAAQSVQQKQGQQSAQTPTNPNATQTPAGAQGTQGSVPPNQVTPGGTQTPQAAPAKPMGTPPQQAAGAPAKPMGVGGAFLSGLTGGKATSLGSLGKLGAQKVAGAAGMNNVATQVSASRQKDVYNNDPSQLATSIQPGQELNIPGMNGIVKVKKSGPQGLELDTSQAKELGVPSIKLNPDALKKLAQAK